MIDLAEHIAELFGDIRMSAHYGISVHRTGTARSAKYRASVPDKVKQWRRDSYVRHRERRLAEAREYYQRNKARRSAKAKARYAARKQQRMRDAGKRVGE